MIVCECMVCAVLCCACVVLCVYANQLSMLLLNLASSLLPVFQLLATPIVVIGASGQ